MLLKNKKVIIVGGSGLIGKKIIKTFLSNGAKVLNLDLKKILIKNSRYNFKNFNCSDLNSMNNNFDQIIKKFGVPDIFINSSYPRTQDWSRI